MEKNRKIDTYVEAVLVFVLGVLAGVAVKVEANKFITIGFDDYKMKFSKNQYSINELQKKMSENGQADENSAEKNGSSQNEENGLSDESQEVPAE